MAKIKKITRDALEELFRKHNVEHNITSQFDDPNPVVGVIVFKQSNWQKKYSVKSRSYRVISSNKMYISGMCGNSIYANCLDGSDQGVRLDWYDWEAEYAYVEKDGESTPEEEQK